MSEHATSRRQMFGSGAALLLLSATAAGSAKAAEIDGGLLAACRSLSRLYTEIQRIDAADDDTPESEAEVYATVDAWWAELNRIIDTPAFTPDGIRAKARATRIALEYLATPMLDQTVEADGRDHERLAWSLVADLLREAES